MWELNLGFRSAAVLFLTSTCFISLVQPTGHTRGPDTTLGLLYKEQRIVPVSIWKYIKTDSGNIPCHETYEKVAQERHTDITTAEWIPRCKSTSKDLPLFFSDHLTPKETSDSNLSAEQPLIELNKIPFLRDHVSLGTIGSCLEPGWNLTVRLRRRSAPIDSSSRYSSPVILFNASFKASVGFSSRYSTSETSFRAKYKDVANRNQPPLETCSAGLSHGATVGITVGVVAVALLLARCLYNRVYRNNNAEISSTLLNNSEVQLMPAQGRFACISVDKSMEFSYEELSKATYDFCLHNKIGQGGSGAVYYAELRGEKVAIKKMDMRASKEFLAELKVLTHAHHINLVRLIGYCVEGSLFLVNEYIENGNLSQHLHGSGRDPLPWSIRVQIAVDSARAIEYIHEYTVSIFIHCDIKSANILIDKNFHAKVADFGLTKLTGVGSTSRLGGTFGYMPPEYVQYGEVSPKVDVYAFGVVLYELISAKQAIIRANDPDNEPKSLISLFDEVLSQAYSKDDLVKMIDPRLGDNYPLDSVHKMGQLAKACTHEDPRQRPSMRSIVIALMTLSSSIEDYDVGSFC